MAIGDALTAPTGVQNQMVGQPSRVPGYSQGLSQAPGQMALPPEPMPIGRPTAVVGGPAYFTPQGYNAPPQPTEAFMPTDRMPDPIGQQFMRQMQSPMGQQFQQQYEATQAPIREAEMAQRAEEQAAQDTRFQEMMDRIAELEGQLATPTPSPVPEPEPYIPGQTPFPGIPDFIRDLDFSNIDFSNIPGLSNFDYDDIMRQYNDRIEMGEPEPIESFLPDPRDLPPIGLNPPPGGFGGRDFDNPSFRDAGAMPPENNFFVDGDGNLNVSDGIIRPMGMPAGPPIAFYGDKTNEELQTMFEDGRPIGKEAYPDFVPDRTTDRFNQIQAEKKANQVLQTKRSNAGTEETLGDGRIRITDRDGNVTFKENPAPAPAPVYTPPPQMSRRPMIPNFGRMNLR